MSEFFLFKNLFILHWIKIEFLTIYVRETVVIKKTQLLNGSNKNLEYDGLYEWERLKRLSWSVADVMVLETELF